MITTDLGGDFGWQRTVVSSLDEQSSTGIPTGWHRRGGGKCLVAGVYRPVIFGESWGIPVVSNWTQNIGGCINHCKGMCCMNSGQRPLLGLFGRWCSISFFEFWVCLDFAQNQTKLPHIFTWVHVYRRHQGNTNDTCQRLSTIQSTSKYQRLDVLYWCMKRSWLHHILGCLTIPFN